MGVDVFRREVEIGTPFASDAAAFKMNDSDVSLVQQFNMNYQQSAQQLWEVGGNRTYLMGGKPQGTAQMNKVITPGGEDLSADLYDICQVQNNQLNVSLGQGCDETTDEINLKMHGVLVTNFGISTTSQNVIVTKTLQMMFLYLSDA